MLVWFRRDLRDNDNATPGSALGAHRYVHCVCIFDTEGDAYSRAWAQRRNTFLWESVRVLKIGLEARASQREAIPSLASFASAYARRPRGLREL